MDVTAHPETWLDWIELGSKGMGYQPTYRGPSEYINAYHESFAHCETSGGLAIAAEIPGKLRRADALKLYELAYHARGDILELGCEKGLATSIMARAIRDSGHGSLIYAQDAKSPNTIATKRNLTDRDLGDLARTHTGDAALYCRELIEHGRRFSLIFIDHASEYGPMRAVCSLLDRLVETGGFALFHDYNDKRNQDPGATDHGVGLAVQKDLNLELFEFYGIYGCVGLFRKTEAGELASRRPE